jgi:dolichol-phosphate mannosyltransferase
LVELRRNAGQQQAIAAGLVVAKGDWVVTLDADLQDPPELLPEMLDAAALHHVDVVYTSRADRDSDGRVRAAAASLYYKLVRRVAGVPVEPHVGDYRLMSRKVIDALNALPERQRVHRLLLPWLGFPSATLTHTRDARAAGRTHYSVARLVRITVDSVVSFTSVPLRWATMLGLMTGTFSFLLALGAILAQLSGHSIPGWASLAVAVTFIGGVQLICTGILGEYIARVFVEVQGRPPYDISQVSRPAAQASERAHVRRDDLHEA